MINENAKKIIKENAVAIATSNNNQPNVIAVAFVKVIDNNKILITDNFMKKTKEDIETNPNVCLAVWDKDWNGYKIIGQAKYFATGKYMDLVKAMPENEGLPAKGAILIEVSELLELK
ncbi:MAG: pyridoxamine 5'-phosphate oxidase family protein [Candidatus Berkelbacteria bacterium]